MGGLGLINPTTLSNVEYGFSRVATSKLTDKIKKQLLRLPEDFSNSTRADTGCHNKKGTVILSFLKN